jgi:predicted Zn-dependent peptidase
MPIEFRTATLPNGLTILAEIDPSAASAGAGFFVRTGARDEDPAEMGVSHFLEHMVFKGSESRGPIEVSAELDALGVNHNAFTAHDLTAYFAIGLPESVLPAVEVFADILRPSLRDADFDEERGVILEEIAMYEDQPSWVLLESVQDRFYEGHPLGHRVLGTRETITALRPEQMRRYLLDRYASDSIALAAAGRIDFEALVERAGRACGNWKPSGASRVYPPLEPQGGEFTLLRPNLASGYGLMALPAPPLQDDRRYAASLAAQILGDAEGSRLFWALVEPGLAEQADANYDPRDHAGEFSVGWICPPSAMGEVEQIVLAQMASFADSLEDADLERARAKIATSVTLASERPGGRMHRLGANWALRREHRPLEEELARIEAVTIDEMRSCLEAFPLQARVTGRLMPA